MKRIATIPAAIARIALVGITALISVSIAPDRKPVLFCKVENRSSQKFAPSRIRKIPAMIESWIWAAREVKSPRSCSRIAP